MNLQQLLSRVGVPVLGIGLVAMAYHWYGWPGVFVALTALVFWALLHFNRVMAVLKRAADRPVGFVDSAVMLHAKLRQGMSLLHVVAMTRSIGEQRSPEGAQPEVFRWTDGSRSHVTCEFQGGRLRAWSLERPPAEDAPA